MHAGTLVGGLETAGAQAREGHFSRDGAMPLNLHGGLLSYGHCGVAGAMAHLAEAHRQMTGRAGVRQVRRAGVTLNWVDLPVGSFHNRLITMRTVVMPSARMAISSLVQYNAAARTVGGSARLRWEYSPGSELFLVYTEGRNTEGPHSPELLNRSVAVKVTRLLRF